MNRVTIRKHYGKYRIVDVKTDTTAKNSKGKPVDHGGYVTYGRACRAREIINGIVAVRKRKEKERCERLARCYA